MAFFPKSRQETDRIRCQSSSLYLSMILGTNFSSESGPEILLNVSLLLRFGGQMTTKKGTTWLLITKKGATWSMSAPSLLQRSRPNGSRGVPSPGSAELRPGFCCLSNVCRRPPPRSRLPVRVAAFLPRQVKAAQEARSWGAGALVLALTGVADLSNRTGGSYPLLASGAESASAGSETSTSCPCRSACCKR
jgi:hypothetical protein